MVKLSLVAGGENELVVVGVTDPGAELSAEIAERDALDERFGAGEKRVVRRGVAK